MNEVGRFARADALSPGWPTPSPRIRALLGHHLTAWRRPGSVEILNGPKGAACGSVRCYFRSIIRLSLASPIRVGASVAGVRTSVRLTVLTVMTLDTLDESRQAGGSAELVTIVLKIPMDPGPASGSLRIAGLWGGFSWRRQRLRP